MSDVQIAVIDQQDTQIVLAVPGVQGATGSSIPSGGTTDQVLRKNSSTNYDAGWTQVTSAMIADGAIVNADVNNGAAIAGTKISPDFGGQAVTTTGQVNAARVNVTANTAPTNGIYLPSANNVAISTGGSGRLFVDADGEVGIGASSPDGLLTLAGANSNVPRLRIQHPSSDRDAAISTYFDGSGTYLFVGSNHYTNSSGLNAKFDATSGSSAWYLDGSGLGIFYNSSGSGSITERLRIRADGTFEIKGGGTAGTSPAFSINPSASANSLVINSSGLVGIGISSVNTKLEIAGNNDAVTENNTLRFTDTDASTEANQQIGKIEFYSSDVSVPGAGVKAYIGAFAADTSPDAYLSFATQDGGVVSTPVERVRITSDGKVGIGTTSPSSLLHLADAGDITVGTTTGTKIGTATTQKLGFYNATPVVQPAAVANATDAATVITQLNDLLSKLRTLGIIAT